MQRVRRRPQPEPAAQGAGGQRGIRRGQHPAGDGRAQSRAQAPQRRREQEAGRRRRRRAAARGEAEQRRARARRREAQGEGGQPEGARRQQPQQAVLPDPEGEPAAEAALRGRARRPDVERCVDQQPRRPGRPRQG
jgi:hypothetical protein